jgi:hypothetical protein
VTLGIDCTGSVSLAVFRDLPQDSAGFDQHSGWISAQAIAIIVRTP